MTIGIGILIVLAFLVYSLMSTMRPMWAFALLVMMWTVEQLIQSYIPFFYDNGILFNVYVAGIVGIAAARRVLSSDSTLKEYFNITLLLTTMLYGLGLISLIWTRDSVLAREVINWLAPYIFISVYLATLLPNRIEDFDDFRKVFLIVGTLVLFFIVINPSFQFYGDRAMVNLGGTSSRGNPLAIAETGALLAITAALSRDRGLTGFKAVLRGAVVIIGLGIALQTGSRGNVIAGMLVIIILYPIARKSENLTQTLINLFSLLAFILIMYVAASTFITNENMQRWSIYSIMQGGSSRAMFLQMYLTEFLKSPQVWAIGFGTQSFSAVVPGAPVDMVENLFAEMLFDLGIPGFTLMLLIVGITFQKSIWMIRNAPTQSARINSVLLLGFWISYALFAAKQYNLWTGFPFFYISIVITKCALVAQREWPALDDAEYEDEYEYDDDGDDDELIESIDHHDAHFS